MQKWLSELRQESRKKPVVVEGKKDSAALGKFGIKTEQLHRIHSSISKRIDELSENKECILLFDMDESGRRFHAKVKGDLQRSGVKVTDHFRNFLLSNTNLRFIEGVDTYIKNLQKDEKRNPHPWNR